MKNKLLNDITGIYVFGSYAKKEEDENSDIDILILTNKTNKFLKMNDFEITLISEKIIESNIKKDLYIISIIKEAKPILNNSKLEYLRSKINIKKFKLTILNEIRRVLKFNELVIKGEDTVNSGVVYSLILRYRELYFLDCLFNNKLPAKKEFKEIVGNNELYKIYEDIKNDINNEKHVDVKEATKILNKSKELLTKWEKKRGFYKK